jgi:hypothetical protein
MTLQIALHFVQHGFRLQKTSELKLFQKKEQRKIFRREAVEVTGRLWKLLIEITATYTFTKYCSDVETEDNEL